MKGTGQDYMGTGQGYMGTGQGYMGNRQDCRCILHLKLHLAVTGREGVRYANSDAGRGLGGCDSGLNLDPKNLKG